MKKLISFSKMYGNKSIHNIKLRNLLELRGPRNALKEIRTMFPPTEIGSITLVDQITLLTLVELVNPKRILEIGTYQGYSTRLFIRNTDAEEILSVDLPEFVESTIAQVDADKVLSDGDYNDEYLRSTQNRTGTFYLNDLIEPDRQRLRLIKCDSTKLNYIQEVGQIEFAFIDGGHNYDIVSKDTFNVIGQMKSGVIVWHDYSSSIHSDVTRFLAEHSKSNQVFYVSGGLSAFQVIRGEDGL